MEFKEKVFSNVGNKIKNIAFIHFCVVSIISVILGFLLFDSMYGDFLVGFLVMVIGVVGAWLVSLFTYAFGILIEKVIEISEK